MRPRAAGGQEVRDGDGLRLGSAERSWRGPFAVIVALVRLCDGPLSASWARSLAAAYQAVGDDGRRCGYWRRAECPPRPPVKPSSCTTASARCAARRPSILKRLDWLGRLRFHDCRDTAGIPPNTAHLDPDRMIAGDARPDPGPDQGATPGSGRSAGSPAAPALWPLYPLLFIPGMPRLGQRLYLWVARNRFHLVPCHDGVCTIPPKQE